jgi:hypothetical protein
MREKSFHREEPAQKTFFKRLKIVPSAENIYSMARGYM